MSAEDFRAIWREMPPEQRAQWARALTDAASALWSPTVQRIADQIAGRADDQARRRRLFLAVIAADWDAAEVELDGRCAPVDLRGLFG